MKKINILDYLYPPRCPVCDKPVLQKESHDGFCATCLGKLPIIRGKRCCKCGRALSDLEKEYCSDCLKYGLAHIYDKGLALCTYDDALRDMIYRLKYGNRSEYANALGKLLADSFATALKRAGAEGVVAVPLHEKRIRKRGYNQAELLAKSFCMHSGIPFYKHYVERVKDTKPLKSMSRPERQNNLKKAFKIGKNDVKLKVSIVIDDIYTTGSTIDALAEVLKEAGVHKVYFLTVAIGDD
ncbi:MAG: ComF family protein [Lachnospiraceae bacterium]|nr:ComF family protein [Lachnospiraceae bacterium]